MNGIGTVGASLTAPSGADMPSKQSAVSREFDQLFMEIERLGQVAGKLVERIQPVLGPTGPENESEKNAVAPPAVALADTIRQARVRITNYSNELVRVIQRIEI